MSLTEEVAAGVSQAIAPIAENFVNTLSRNLGISKDSPLLSQLSGKTVVIVTEKFGKISITMPELNKPNA